MRSRKEIQKKLAQVRYRHLKKLKRTGLSRRPCNCAHNVTVGEGNNPNRPNLGVCTFKVTAGQDPDGVCDENFGGKARAQNCPVFQVNQTADEIKEDFDTFLKNASFGEIAYHFPDMAALLWVLKESPESSTEILGPEEDFVEPIKPSKSSLQEYPQLNEFATDERNPFYLELLRRFRE